MVAGLVGVGGGIIFAPILLFVYQTFGLDEQFITPVTIATSLFCTFFASLGGTIQHYRTGHVVWPLIVRVGFLSIVFVVLTVNFVTTQSWYSKDVFRIVFGSILVLVSVRMLISKKEPPLSSESSEAIEGKTPVVKSLSTSALAGFISAAAGVGGGVILVPSYNKLIKLPLINAVASSSATISIITFFATLAYIIQGYQATELFGPLGWVDYKTGILLAIPAIIFAQLGARSAQHMDRNKLRIGFSLFALFVAAKLLWSAFSNF